MNPRPAFYRLAGSALLGIYYLRRGIWSSLWGMSGGCPCNVPLRSMHLNSTNELLSVYLYVYIRRYIKLDADTRAGTP